MVTYGHVIYGDVWPCNLWLRMAVYFMVMYGRVIYGDIWQCNLW